MTDTGLAMAGGKEATKHVRAIREYLEKIDERLRPQLDEERQKRLEMERKVGEMIFRAAMAEA